MPGCPKTGCLGRPSPGDLYCRICGTPLGPDHGVLRRIVEEALSERLSDRSLIELDLAQAVRSRLLSSAKTYAFFLGIPLAILGLALGTVGITSYSEFSKTLEATSTQLEEKVGKAVAALEQETAAISAKAEKLKEEYAEQELALAEFRARAPALEQAAEEVANLQRRVEAIEIFGKKARPLSGEEKRKAERAMESYRGHLRGLGWPVEGNPAVYAIEEKEGQYEYTLYDPVERRIALGSDWDVYSLLVMYGHYALNPAATRGSSYSGTVLWAALSDYLAWSYLNGTDPGSVSKWSKTWAPERNLGELLADLRYDSYGSEQFYARSLIREALVDAEASIGAAELGRLVLSTWRQTSVSSPRQIPDEAVRSFVEQLQADARLADAIGVAFAKVGLVEREAEGKSAN